MDESGFEYDIFLSYGRGDDQSVVESVYNLLTEEGFRVWWDRTCMPQREIAFTDEIKAILSKTERIILFVGPYSSRSEYVNAEWNYGRRCGCAIHTILYTASPNDNGAFDLVPKALNRFHITDLRDFQSQSEKTKYELSLLIKNLRAPLPPLGELYNFPKIPEGYIHRAGCVEELAGMIIKTSADSIVSKKIITVFGMAGSGKTVIVNSLCHESDVRRLYGDGILWLNITQNFDIHEIWARISSIYAPDTDVRDVDVKSFRTELEKVMKGKKALFVLDDVWDVAVIDMFSNSLYGLDVDLLITTRDKTLINGYDSDLYKLEVMSDSESVELLSKYSKVPVLEMPREAYELLMYVNNLPIAIAIIGALFRDGKSWSSILHRFEKTKGKISIRMPGYLYTDALTAIDVSVNALNKEHTELYTTLAVFPKSTNIPIKVIVMMWSKLGYDEWGTEDFLSDLENKALLTFNKEKGYVRLHDLQADYLQATLLDVMGLHKEFVDAYRSLTGGDWINGPNDGYYYQKIIYHMVSSGDISTACNLLSQYDWIRKKINLDGVLNLNRDYSMLMDRGDVPEHVKTIGKGLLLSIPILCYHPDQLSEQLWGRLQGSGNEEIDRLLSEARDKKEKSVWLRPMFRGFVSPLGPTYEPIDYYTLYRPFILSSNNLYVGTDIGIIHIIDNREGVKKKSVHAHEDKITKLIICGNYLYSASWDNSIKVWDLCTLESIGVIDLGDDRVEDIAVAGEYIFVGTYGGNIYFYDRELKSPVFTDTAHNTRVRYVKNLEGNRFAVCFNSNEICVWDLKSFEIIKTYYGHTDWISSMSSHSNLLATGSWDLSVRIWDLDSDQCKWVLTGHGGSIVALCFVGNYLFSASWDGLIIKWNYRTGVRLGTLNGHSSAVTSLVYDGKHLVSTSLDCTLRYWDIDSGKCIKSVNLGHGLRKCVMFENQLYCTTQNDIHWLKDDGTNVKLYTYKNRRQMFLLGCGEKIYYCTSHGMVQRWDIATGVITTIARYNSIRCAAASDTCLYLSTKKGIIKLSDDKKELIDLGDWSHQPTQMEENQNILLIADDEGYLCMLDKNGSRQLHINVVDITAIRSIDGDFILGSVWGDLIRLSSEMEIKWHVTLGDSIYSMFVENREILIGTGPGFIMKVDSEGHVLMRKKLLDRGIGGIAGNKDYYATCYSNGIVLWSKDWVRVADFYRGGEVFDILFVGDVLACASEGKQHCQLLQVESPKKT